MKRIKVLCLTDHAKHSKENSIYALLSQLCVHNLVEKVVVASRSVVDNHSFFYEGDFENIKGVELESEFVFEKANDQFLQDSKEFKTEEFDTIFLRIARPVEDQFLLDLEEYFKGKCIINRPSGIIQTSNKSSLLHFQEVCPPVKLCYSISEIMEFASKHAIVLKPLKEYGGRGLLKIKDGVLNDGKEDHNIHEYLNGIESVIEIEGYLAMKYLKNVSQGDKRLLVVGGEILAASLRLPPEGSWLCNVSAGGKSIKAEVEKEEIEIVEKIKDFMESKGILIYGVDTLVDDDGKRILSEVNTLSIGGFPQAEQQTGKPIVQNTIDKIISYAVGYK